MEISRTKDRIKSTGEVFTPLPLVDEILDKLPSEVWAVDKTYLDPSCGDGNFLVRVIAYKIANGATTEEALSTTYGVDLMSDNVKLCRQRVLTNAYAADICGRRKVLKHLTHHEEFEIAQSPECVEFFKEHKHIVLKNIVCHDALTYDYSFETIAKDDLSFNIVSDTIEVEPDLVKVKQPDPTTTTEEKLQQQINKLIEQQKGGYSQAIQNKIGKLQKQLNGY